MLNDFIFSAKGTFRLGDVRLEGGSYNWEGRVEIFLSGVWATLSDPEWTEEDALVVCRQLHHSEVNRMSHTRHLSHSFAHTLRDCTCGFCIAGKGS